MTFPLIKIATINELKELFGWNYGIKHHQNISILGEKFLIYTLKKEGYDFDFTIAREERGKPYFQCNNGIHFSISDTKDYIAVAIHNKRVGIDIEYLRENKRELAQRFFHSDESGYLNNIISSKEQLYSLLYDMAFTQLWTIKEAYVKMTGTGIAGNFATIDLSPETFKINQNYYKNGHQIVSYRDKTTDLFVSICME